MASSINFNELLKQDEEKKATKKIDFKGLLAVDEKKAIEDKNLETIKELQGPGEIARIGIQALKGAASIPKAVGGAVGEGLEQILEQNFQVPTEKPFAAGQEFGPESLGVPINELPQTSGGRFAGDVAEFSASGGGGTFSKGSKLFNAVKSELVAAVGGVTGGRIAETIAPDSDITKFILEFGGSLTPSALKAGINRLVAGGNLVDEKALIRSTGQEAEAFAAEKAVGAEGVLLPAQRAADPFLVRSQSFLSELPETTRLAADALNKQNKEVFKAVEDTINAVSPAAVVAASGKRLITAADKSIELRKAIRKEAASPLYTQSFSDAGSSKLRVDTSKVKNVLNEKATEFSIETKLGKEIDNARKAIEDSALKGTSGPNGEIIVGTNLKALHGAKRDIDRRIEEAVRKEDGTLASELMDIKNALVESMTDVSPKYLEAKNAFEELTPQVKELQESLVGQAASMNKADSFAVAQKIFGSGSPENVKQARRIIEKVSPEAWRGIVRSELEKRFGGLKELIDDTGTLAVENVPSKMKTAIFGNPRSRQMLLSSMDKKTRRSFVDLETVLKRASLGRFGGSPTGINDEIKRRMRSIIGKARLAAQPLELLARGGDEALTTRSASKQAERFFDTDGFNAEMIKIKREGKASDPKILIRALVALDDAFGEDVKQEQEQ